jgi:hypothetical protein
MEYNTCGECKYFVKDEKGAFGICQKREYLISRRCGYLDRKFYPARSRTACKKDFEKR